MINTSSDTSFHFGSYIHWELVPPERFNPRIAHNKTFNALLSAGVATGFVGIMTHRPINYIVALVTFIVCGIYGHFPPPRD